MSRPPITFKQARALAKERGFTFLLEGEDSASIGGVNQKYSWKCAASHTWKATYNSIQQGRGCPQCHKIWPVNRHTKPAKSYAKRCAVSLANQGRCPAGKHVFLKKGHHPDADWVFTHPKRHWEVSIFKKLPEDGQALPFRPSGHSAVRAR